VGYAYAISGIAAVGGLLFGFDTAIIAGADEFVKRDFQLAAHPHIEGFVVSSLLIGCMVGAGAAGALSDRLGRKKVLLASAALYVISAILSAVPRSIAGLTGSRFLGGLAVGTSSMVAPMYIAELAPAHIRGRLVTLNQMAIVTGILLANLVSLFLVDASNNWRLMFASAAIPAFVLLVALLAVPESPRWLAKQRQDQRALEILERVNGAERATGELQEIRRALAQEEGSFAELLRPGLRVALVIGVTLAVLGQVSGINSIIYYAPKVFLAAGMEQARAAMFATVMVGLTNFLSTIVSLWLIDKVGRKALLLLGTGGMTVSLILAGACLPAPAIPIPLKVAIVLAYIAAFGIGVGGVVWVVIAEIFPNKVRGRGAATATVAVWAACFLVAQTFPYLIATLSHRVFWIYAVMAAAMFLFTWRVVPETKGRTLEEIEKLWRRSGNTIVQKA
jgi:sugar porter (SP) family MFS transporter